MAASTGCGILNSGLNFFFFFIMLSWAVKQLLCLTTDVGAFYGRDSSVYVCVHAPINKHVYI